MSTPLVSPTVQTILQAVRNLLGQPDPANSFWTDAELLAYLNEAVRVHFVELTDVDEGYFTTTAPLNIVSGTEATTLPSDFFKIKNLWKKVNGGYMPLSYRNILNEGYSTQGGSDAESFYPSYCFRGNSLILHPTPSYSETAGLLLEYMQFPDTLLSGSDTLTAQISPAFRQVVEAYMVYMAKYKESLVNGVNTYAVAKDRLSELEAQFKEAARLRSKNPHYIQPFNPES